MLLSLSPSWARALCGFLALCALGHAAGIIHKRGTGFVAVKKGIFMLNCRRFVYAGSNSWDLMKNASDPSTIWTVDDTMKRMISMNLTVARTWGFMSHSEYPLQISPGVYNETAFRALDYVIHRARVNGIRLIIALADYWSPAEGVSKYVKWAGMKNSDNFYTSPKCRRFYLRHVKTVLERRNHFSGIRYNQDPTIMAWDLLNEPRCFRDSCSQEVQDWVKSMSVAVKALDRNHLLTTGFEGFYSSSREKQRFNPGEPWGDWASHTGQNFIANHGLASIDFAVAHLWIENWISQETPEQKIAFARSWVEAHNRHAKMVLKKPLVWEEFGMADLMWNGTSAKTLIFSEVLPIMFQDMVSGGAVQGTNFWVLNSPDGAFNYTIDPKDEAAKLIQEYAVKTAVFQKSVINWCNRPRHGPPRRIPPHGGQSSPAEGDWTGGSLIPAESLNDPTYGNSDFPTWDGDDTAGDTGAAQESAQPSLPAKGSTKVSIRLTQFGTLGTMALAFVALVL